MREAICITLDESEFWKQGLWKNVKYYREMKNLYSVDDSSFLELPFDKMLHDSLQRKNT